MKKTLEIVYKNGQKSELNYEDHFIGLFLLKGHKLIDNVLIDDIKLIKVHHAFEKGEKTYIKYRNIYPSAPFWEELPKNAKEFWVDVEKWEAQKAKNSCCEKKDA